MQNSDTVMIAISHLSFKADSPIMRNPDIKMLFVEYRLLGIPLEETETPFSMPKPKPNSKAAFNFMKGEIHPFAWFVIQ